MARPRRSRKIGVIPEYRCFAPEDVRNDDSVDITLDEYEAMRLIDSCGLNQEEAAKQMDVSRTTVTAIYESVRKKIADSIVYGKTLYIVSDDSCCSKDARYLNEDAHRGEQARSRWPRPGATGGGKSELEPGSRSQRGGGPGGRRSACLACLLPAWAGS